MNPRAADASLFEQPSEALPDTEVDAVDSLTGAARSATGDSPITTAGPSPSHAVSGTATSASAASGQRPLLIEDDVDRADVIGAGGRWLAGWCLRFLLFGAAAALLLWILDKVWVGLLPVILALIVSTVLWPIVALLKRIRIPNALGALISIVGTIAIVSGVFSAIAPSVARQSDELAKSTIEGVRRLQSLLADSPVSIDNDQIDQWITQGTRAIEGRIGDIATGVVSGVSSVTSVVLTLLIMLVLTFFFLKDGEKFLPWTRRLVGRRAGFHITELLTRSWNTLGGFIRTQAVVSMVDAVFIGIGLFFLGVPLAFPIAVVTFFAGFIPIIGAFTAGAIAVLIALVANGVTTALLALVLIVAVQQIESHVLQPVLQSRSMNLHPALVLLSVAVGGSLFGIIGTFLAVPVAATLAVWMRYLGEMIDLRSGEKTAADIEWVTDSGQITAFEGERSGAVFRESVAAKRRARFSADGDADNPEPLGPTTPDSEIVDSRQLPTPQPRSTFTPLARQARSATTAITKRLRKVRRHTDQ